MIREKAKDLLTKLKQGSGSATIFGSSYYDEETLQIIEIIANECKAKIIEKNGDIKKYESDIFFQQVKEIWTDCDNDTLLIKVKQNGVACHTREKSCFFRRIN